jgi:hypothetical protein
MNVFWVIALCSLLEVLAASIIRAMMKAASTSETSVNFYQTTRRNNPEGIHLHIRRRENMIFHHKCRMLLLIGYAINKI